MPAPGNTASPRLQLSSLRALAEVVKVCAPRMHRWKGQILEGTLKCWVAAVDKGGEDDRECAARPTRLSVSHHRYPAEAAALKGAIKDVCGALAVACPSVIEVCSLLFSPPRAMG